MKTWQWIAATATAALFMTTSALSYVNAYIYPRKEGEKLEMSVHDLRREHDTDLREIRETLREILLLLQKGK